jgi:hypothetical protein
VLNPLDHTDESRLKGNAPVNAPALVLLLVPAIPIAPNTTTPAAWLYLQDSVKRNAM